MVMTLTVLLLLCFSAVAHPLPHDSGWMYSSGGSNQAGVCEHRGGKHGPAGGSAWTAREQDWCLGMVGSAGLVRHPGEGTGQQSPGRSIEMRQGWDRPDRQPVCLSACGAGGQAQAQPIAHVGDKQLWLSIKSARVRKGNQHQWSIPTAPSGGLCPGSPGPLERDVNVFLVEHF